MTLTNSLVGFIAVPLALTFVGGLTTLTLNSTTANSSQQTAIERNTADLAELRPLLLEIKDDVSATREIVAANSVLANQSNGERNE